MIESTLCKQGYRNEITEYLDEYLIKCEDCVDLFSNYIYPEPINDLWIIRVPGASRGNIKVVDGVIESITLYEDSFCYKKEVLDNLDKFNGRQIDLKEI